MIVATSTLSVDNDSGTWGLLSSDKTLSTGDGDYIMRPQAQTQHRTLDRPKLAYRDRFDIYPPAASLNMIDGSDLSVLAQYFGMSCP